MNWTSVNTANITMNETNQFFDLSYMKNFENFENLTEQKYIESLLGPQHLAMKIVLPITLVYIIIFILGIFGNVVTCWVILRVSAMQTATNYYLFSLAVSDLMLLILGLPFELRIFWQQYPWELGWGLCKIRAYVSETSSYVSVLTIVAFSMERYLAICHPLHLYAINELKRPLRFIFAAWALALIAAIPFALYTEVNYIEFPPGSGRNSEMSAFCAMLLHNMPEFPLYELSCVIFFVVPLILIMVLYIQMGRRIQSTTLGHSIEGTVHGETRQAQSRKAIIRMLTAVVITFFVCWAPFHAQRLLYVYDHTRSLGDVNEWLYILGGCLYYISTAINPLLYNVMSAKYRSAFMETLCCTPSSSHLNRDELSSMRETTIYRCGSCRSSQIARGRNRSVKYPSEFNKDDENDNPHCNDHHRIVVNHKVTNNYELMAEKKFLTVIHSTNGRIKCRSTEKNTLLDETHI